MVLLRAPSNDSADVRIWVALASRGLRNVAEADVSQCNLSSPLMVAARPTALVASADEIIAPCQVFILAGLPSKLNK